MTQNGNCKEKVKKKKVEHKWKILTNKRKCCLIKKAVNRKTRKKSKPVYSKEIKIQKDI